MTTLANSQVASQVTPVFSAILGCLVLGESWLVPEMLTTVATAVGVCLVFQPAFIFGKKGDDTADDGADDAASAASTADGATSDLGIALGLIGSLCSSLAYCMIRLMGTSTPVPFPKLMLVQAIAQVTLSVPCHYLTGQIWAVPDVYQAMMLLGCALLGFCGQLCMTIGMMNSKAASSSLMRQTGIVYAFVYDALLVPGESIALSSCLGAAIITGSTAWLAFSKSSASPVSMETKLSPLSTDDTDDAEETRGGAGGGAGLPQRRGRQRSGTPEEGEALTALEAEARGTAQEGSPADPASRTGKPSPLSTPSKALKAAPSSSGSYSQAACDDHDDARAADAKVEVGAEEEEDRPFPEFGFLWGERPGHVGPEGPGEDDPWAQATWDDDDTSRGGGMQAVRSTLQRLVPPSFGKSYQKLMQRAGSAECPGDTASASSRHDKHGEGGDVELSDVAALGEAAPVLSEDPYAFEDEEMEFA
jgi:drug/metabolite transporter (DMT)-like permease